MLLLFFFKRANEQYIFLCDSSVVNNETGLFNPCSLAVALSGSDALWVLHVGEVLGNDRIWSDGL